MRTILDSLGVHFMYLDAEAYLFGDDPEFWALLNTRDPKERMELTEVLPELVGLEDRVKAILAGDEEKLRVPAVRHGDRYCHISVIPLRDEEKPDARGAVVLADASEELERRHEMLQKTNEIDLLSRTLKFRNGELAAANRRLDRLMTAIRAQNHDLNRTVMEATSELRESRLSLIFTMAEVAEFRDSGTGAHIYRIGRISLILARRLGLAPSEREAVFCACLLHDVGKIGVPDYILLKNSPLTEDETLIMREHTKIGAKLFEKFEDQLFAKVHDVTLYHHERWDGGGYPTGLAGDTIPLGARICAVADVFDALVSRRPYKDAWGFSSAAGYIDENSGTQFDPMIVDAFKASLEELRLLDSAVIADLESLEALLA